MLSMWVKLIQKQRLQLISFRECFGILSLPQLWEATWTSAHNKCSFNVKKNIWVLFCHFVRLPGWFGLCWSALRWWPGTGEFVRPWCLGRGSFVIRLGLGLGFRISIRLPKVYVSGIGPYITSSIIFQILTTITPSLKALAAGEEGEAGREKYKNYIKHLGDVNGRGLVYWAE